ncbi:hypothetical protein E308F_16140 [Moorella sp. E308F]|uniref:hypothetical protein n=1 Tax=unclassified Neomoorella TaxID=2676739 RepID=UPI0010FFC72B|nr:MULTISPECIES: hypothetical protein [unclassified Moorella (in: firmicutes)]GEA15370.1 hypothetical protein E308F_16140 [Moorella sp. E308F]GEA19769.1 hypothetical protein E306M_29080 [Moorella sp. E306M]
MKDDILLREQNLSQKCGDRLCKIFDPTTDLGAYILGILWGAFSISDEGYWLRHRDRWYIEVVKQYFRIASCGHESHSNTGTQWRLKITRAADVAAVKTILERYGWTPRKAPERPYPHGPLDDRGFVRAWVELHGSADVTRIGRKRTLTPRLRVYGNRVLMDDINRVIATGTGLPLRTLQKTVNEATVALYYYGKSFRTVVDWLYAGAELYNLLVRARFEGVLRGNENI